MFTTTKLEDYFDFLSEDDIRIKGHRIGIENVLDHYLQGYTPEEIVLDLPTLSLEEIYTTITYYLHNRNELDSYLLEVEKSREKKYQEFCAKPSPLIQRLKTEKIRRTQLVKK